MFGICYSDADSVLNILNLDFIHFCRSKSQGLQWLQIMLMKHNFLKVIKNEINENGFGNFSQIRCMY